MVEFMGREGDGCWRGWNHQKEDTLRGIFLAKIGIQIHIVLVKIIAGATRKMIFFPKLGLEL